MEFRPRWGLIGTAIARIPLRVPINLHAITDQLIPPAVIANVGMIIPVMVILLMVARRLHRTLLLNDSTG